MRDAGPSFRPDGLRFIRRHYRDVYEGDDEQWLWMRVFGLFLPTLEDWPDEIDLRSERFIVVACADWEKLGDEAIKSWASKMYHQGISTLDTWGPGCERAHDLFDRAAWDAFPRLHGRESGHDDPIVMTMWWARDPMSWAVWRACFAPLIHEVWDEPTRAIVGIAIGDGAMYSQLLMELENSGYPPQFEVW